MDELHRKVSLADVARAAGVAKATASRALSDRPQRDIGSRTRDRVRSVAAELGYTPNRAAQALRTGTVRALGIVVPVDAWSWWAPVVQGAAAEASRAGVQLSIDPVEHTAELDEMLDQLHARAVDGAIILTDHRVSHRGEARMPVLLIDDIELSPSLPTIRSANFEGGYALGRHLVEQGRRFPLIIVADLDAHYTQERVKGFRAAFAEAGLAVKSTHVHVVEEVIDLNPALHAGIEKAIASVEGSIDSIFAIADYMAASVLRTLRQRGFTVPKDIAVVGYDDERAALLLDPPLTTFHQPLKEMGAAAVQSMIRHLNNEEIPLIQMLSGHLVIRSST